MIAAEAFTCAICRCAVGCAAGVPLSQLLHNALITTHYPYAAWQFPTASLLMILLFILTAARAAVYTPAKRMRGLEITETINEL